MGLTTYTHLEHVISCDVCRTTFSGDIGESAQEVFQQAQIRGWKTELPLTSALCPQCKGESDGETKDVGPSARTQAR